MENGVDLDYFCLPHKKGGDVRDKNNKTTKTLVYQTVYTILEKKHTIILRNLSTSTKKKQRHRLLKCQANISTPVVCLYTSN